MEHVNLGEYIFVGFYNPQACLFITHLNKIIKIGLHNTVQETCHINGGWLNRAYGDTEHFTVE